MKKLLSFLMACAMVLSLSAGVLAADNGLARFTIGTRNAFINSDSAKNIEIAITASNYTSANGIDGVIFNLNYETSDLEFVTGSQKVQGLDDAQIFVSGSAGDLKVTIGSSSSKKVDDWLAKLSFNLKTTETSKVGTTIPITGTVQYVTDGNTRVDGGDMVAGGVYIMGHHEEVVEVSPDPNKPKGEDNSATSPVPNVSDNPTDRYAPGVVHYEPAEDPNPNSDGHRPYWWMEDPSAPDADKPALVYWDVDPATIANDPEALKQHTINPTDDEGKPKPYTQKDIDDNTDGNWTRNKVPAGEDGDDGWPDPLTLNGKDGDINNKSDDNKLTADYLLGDVNNDGLIDLRDGNAFQNFSSPTAMTDADRTAVLKTKLNPHLKDDRNFYGINAVGIQGGANGIAPAWKFGDAPNGNDLTSLWNYLSSGKAINSRYENHKAIIDREASAWGVE